MKNHEIRKEIIGLLNSTGREGIKDTIDYLQNSNYFQTGCHSHHRFYGGLAKHSLEACRYALGLSGNIPKESVIIATLLHDVCTSHSYASKGISGHGQRSVKILESVCRLKLTTGEREAILLHMHGDAEQMLTNPLAHLVHKADRASAAGRATRN